MSVEECRLALRMPQSVSFQRSMETSLHGLRMRYAVPTLTIKYSKDIDSGLDHNHEVLLLKEHSVKLRTCELLCKAFSYLGWIISEEAYRIDSKNIKPILALKTLTVYNSFIPHSAKEAKLLYDLLRQKGGDHISETHQ